MAVNEHHDGRPDAADERIVRLYKEAAREEPPARLDSLIAAAARERPPGDASPARTSWWLPWRVPFAFAAVALVSVSLVTLMVEEDRERVLTVAPPAATPAPAPVASAPAAKPEPAAEPAPALANEADSAKRDAPRERRAAVPPLREEDARGGVSRAPGELAAQVQKRGDDERREAASAIETYSQAQKPPPTVARQSAPEGTRDQMTPRADPQPFPAAERPAAAQPAPAAPAAAPPPVSAPAPLPAPAAKPAPKATIGMRGLEELDALGAARRSPALARHLAELDKQPPAVWIERVLALRREGRTAEAEGVLTELKRRYPDVVLPPELR